MKMESSIIQMFANRIDEVGSEVKKALEESYKTRDFCSEGRYALVGPMLSVLHDRLLIAANTLHAIKDFVPHLTLKGNSEADA